MTVVPNGVDDAPDETELPGLGVDVAGTAVGLGVGLGVAIGIGVGRGVGVGVGGGVGAVTTTWPGITKGGGFVSPVLVDWYVTVQLPAGNVDEPVHVPLRALPPVKVKGTVLPATDAPTVTAWSVALPTKCTENRNVVAVVPVVGATVPPVSFAAAPAAPAGVARFGTASASNNQGAKAARILIGPET